MSSSTQLSWALQRLAQLQGTGLDPLHLAAALRPVEEADGIEALDAVCAGLGIDKPFVLARPDRVQLPLIAHTEAEGWGVVVDRDALGLWRWLGPGGETALTDDALAGRTAIVALAIPVPSGAPGRGPSQALVGFGRHVRSTLALYRGELLEAIAASLFIGFFALATSLFSMQVYDRVIPTRSSYTLIILSAGVALSILIELAMKFARSHVMDHVVVGLDNRLSREIFQRLLQLRVDQLPASVGSLAGQMRGYEQVRSFYTASTLFALVDLPLGLLFLVIIGLIGTPLVAAVPLGFGIVALLIGISIRRKVTQLAQEGAALSNMKTGLLVEAVEGAETIKAGAGGWKFLSRWLAVTGQTIYSDLRMRNASEGVGYLSGTIQQISYAGLVIAGAWGVMQGHMTMGALIACSILSGRVLSPVLALPGLMVQHAHARAAQAGLEKLYELKTDNHGIDQPLVPERIRGHYAFDGVKFAYGDNPDALQIGRLDIQPGERVVVLGPIGAGKSTLLRLLSGMYHPREGRILLDGLDLTHISRQVISQHVGYLQQDHRLFQGTLRENLLVGLPDPGDDVLLKVMERTGMGRFVASHPKGLGRPIMEGGKGLSGGQRQLVAFTRLVLCNTPILLLDEPTATMDEDQERRCLGVLSEEAQAGKTLVIVTHKPVVLQLATRIVVVAGSGIVMDGPRDAVLQQLAARNAAQRPATVAAGDAPNPPFAVAEGT